MGRIFRPVSRFLSDDGLTTGGKSLAVDGGTPVPFWIEDVDDNGMVVTHVSILVKDSAMGVGTYGAISALANGLLLATIDAEGAIEDDLLDGMPAKTNGDLCAVADTVSCGDLTGSSFVCVYHLAWQHGLYLQPGYKLRATVQDDLRALEAHSIYVRGYHGGPT